MGASVNCSQHPELCVAGFDTNQVKIFIEDPNNVGAYQTAISPTNAYANNITFSRNFSQVDNNLSPGQYRYYNVAFQSSATQSGICDVIGNCVTPSLKFRVVAGAMDPSKSGVNITKQNTAANKMLADGNNTYAFSAYFKDAYGNYVRSVISAENNNQTIKKLNVTEQFDNGLYEDQRSNTPSGAKGVIVADADAGDTHFTNSINTSGNVVFNRLASNTNTDYNISIASKVPTVRFYPYVANSDHLQLANLNSATDASVASAVSSQTTFPSTEPRIGNFTSNIAPLPNGAVAIVADSGGLTETGGTLGNISVDATAYGNATVADNTGITLASVVNRTINFEFAPLLVYGITNWNPLVDGQYITHHKNFFKIDPSLTDTNYDIYEKNLVGYLTNKDEQP